MTDTQLNLQTITLSDFAVTPAQPNVAVPTEPGRATRWEALAVDNTGHVYAVLPVLGNPKLNWPLDDAVQATFKISMDVDLTQLPIPDGSITPTREVQLYRNGALIFWGVPVARRGNTNDRVWEYTAYDPLWYFKHRYFGEAARHNYLANGDFETDLSGWTATGGITQSQSATQSILGTKSLKLVGTTTNQETYSLATFTITPGIIGVALFLTAWIFVESYTNQAFGERAMYIGFGGISPLEGEGAAPDDLATFAAVTLDDSSAPVGKWSRLTTYVQLPPNATQTVQVRLYAPEGTVYWDAVTVTVEESLGFITANSPGGAGWDQTTIAKIVAAYLAGEHPVGAIYTKSSLNIATAGAASGIIMQRTYQFFDHQNGFDALTEFTTSSDGFDFRIEITPTTRTFTTYYPSVGTTWPLGRPFRWERDADTGRSRSWGITSVDWSETLEGSASDITEMGGWGTGSGREEAAYSNPTAFGDLTLELVESAPNEAPIDLLSDIAASRGAQLSKPILTPVLTMVEPTDPKTGKVLVNLIGVLLPGDLLPLIIQDGSMSTGDPGVAEYVRVSNVTLNEDETLTVAVSP